MIQMQVNSTMKRKRTRRNAGAAPALLLTRLQRDILRVLLYFDIFKHPLKAEELYSFLPSNSTNPSDILRICQSHPLTAIVSRKESYIFMRSTGESCVEERLQKERLASRRWRIARAMAMLICRFPFVRGVFVSGELSKGVASEQGDIDYVVVTRERRLWICRTMLILFKKVFLLNSKKYFCLNHFISEDHLTVDLRNLYSATEVATLKPVSNGILFQRFVDENAWVADFFPNLRWPWESTPSETSRSSIVQHLLEQLLPESGGDRLDAWLMDQWVKVWNHRYVHLDPATRNRLFHCSRHLSTAYGEDFQSRIMNGYYARLSQFGIEEDDAITDN